jgi:hypothetical protein
MVVRAPTPHRGARSFVIATIVVAIAAAIPFTAAILLTHDEASALLRISPRALNR